MTTWKLQARRYNPEKEEYLPKEQSDWNTIHRWEDGDSKEYVNMLPMMDTYRAQYGTTVAFRIIPEKKT